jgi:16S rRNA processing protein RimM
LSSSTDRIVVGRIGKPHGLNGEVTVLPDTDDPERFVAGSSFVTDTGRALSVVSAKQFRDKGLIVLFEGFSRRDAAETLRGQMLTVDPEARRRLDDDEFWPADLVGLVAVTPQGEALGVVDRLEFGPGQDRLVVVTPDEREVLVPFVSDIVADPADGEIVIDAPEGLFGD